jgi:hypothetical protein
VRGIRPVVGRSAAPIDLAKEMPEHLRRKAH